MRFEIGEEVILYANWGNEQDQRSKGVILEEFISKYNCICVKLIDDWIGHPKNSTMSVNLDYIIKINNGKLENQNKSGQMSKRFDTYDGLSPQDYFRKMMGGL